jgi:hypothetical protein
MIEPAAIIDLEAALDAALVDRRSVERFHATWLEPATRWSRAIWDAAVALGPADITDATQAQGMALAARPVFICGAHRSGTTLMRDLLDGHPALAVLPSEASYFGDVQQRMTRLSADDAASLLGQIWLRRLVNPNNQPPFWLLGRSSAGQSPYLDFARRLRAWLAAVPAPSPGAWPLAAVALGYAGRREGVARWVEKTPGTERHLDRIWSEFPDAKVIHVVRAPRDVAMSHKALIRRADDSATGMAAALRALIRSYRIAARRGRRESPGRYRIVRYEDLVARRAGVMNEIGDFLAIAPHDTLLRPTAAGLATAKNSSFAELENRAPLRFTLRERILLAAATACYRALPAAETAQD